MIKKSELKLKPSSTNTSSATSTMSHKRLFADTSIQNGAGVTKTPITWVVNSGQQQRNVTTVVTTNPLKNTDETDSAGLSAKRLLLSSASGSHLQPPPPSRLLLASTLKSPATKLSGNPSIANSGSSGHVNELGTNLSSIFTTGIGPNFAARLQSIQSERFN